MPHTASPPVLPAPAPRARPSPAPAPAADAGTDGWAGVLGATWRLQLLALLAFVVIGGALRPLGDADLPMHLATGEWIARHHAVPAVEPFAWTAAGAPYYTHQWAPQLLFYAVYSALGPLGLRLLYGIWLATAGAAAFALGRAAGWSPAATLTAGVANVIAPWAVAVVALRPQLVLFTLVPLAWALAFALARAGRPRRLYAALFATSVVAVNSHLFFPLVLAPVFALWAAGQMPPRRARAAAAAVVLAWGVTPYALAWPRLLHFMGAHGAIFHYPSLVEELKPGFVALTTSLPATLLPLLVLPLLALPWLLTGEPARLRLVAALYWTVGLVGFGGAVRLVLVWWLLALPFLGMALDRLRAGAAGRAGPAAPGPAVRPGVKWLSYGGGVAALAVQLWASVPALAAEGTAPARRLPIAVRSAVQPVADWLAANTRPGSGGRILTGFDYGGYLTWRLPGYSASVDSRGSFADSLLAPETLEVAATGREQLGPWRTADLAIVPLRWHVAAVLDTAADWHRVAVATGADSTERVLGLWVRGAWWGRAGRAPLPAAPLALAAPRPR